MSLLTKLPVFIITWILFGLLKTVAIVLGLFIVPPLAIFHKYTTKSVWATINHSGKEILVWRGKIFWLWSNNEDGVVAGEEWLNMPTWFRIIYWSAIRNPANNLRFVPYLNVKIVPSKVQFMSSDFIKTLEGGIVINGNLYMLDEDRYRFTTLTAIGLYSNIRVQHKMFGKIWRFWIGWKIYPHDSLGIAPSDYRAQGAGFAIQWKRIHPR